MKFELGLRFTEVERGVAMQYFIDKYSESPDVSFGSVDILDEALWSHIDGASNINVFPLFPRLTLMYVVLFAKPKSAILATPFLKKILAIFISLCTMLC